MPIVCPRCGGKGVLGWTSYKDKRYYYVVHKGGRRCWLGAEAYEYVEGVTGLDLRGALDRLRHLDYAVKALKHVRAELIKGGLDKSLVLRKVEVIEEELRRIKELLSNRQ